MSMGVDIKRVVQDLGRVTIDQVLQESIMNSIQANAHNINIEIDYSSLDKDFPNHVIQVKIIDDGDGFTKENTESFGIYKSTLKQEMGAKGVGRFLFLKLFELVSIDSLDKHISFNIDDVIVKDSNKQNDKTCIVFSQPIEVSIDLTTIEQSIKEHFLPYFHLNKKQIVTISLKANDENIFVIKSSDIPKFETSTFQIDNHGFTINYVLDAYNNQKNNGFYCADNRVVFKNNKDNKTRLKSFGNVNIIFLLSSDYFDNTVNETRDDFSINPRRTGKLFGDLSWEDILLGLSEILKEILLENDIDIDKQSNEELEKAIDKAPYLSKYLFENPFGQDCNKLIESAEKSLNHDKEILRSGLYKNDADFKQRISFVTQSELAEYIFDRQRIIDKLKQITDANYLEKEIHNLFMQQYTTDDTLNYKSNNLWLFDDRFMVYDKVFSEEQIKDVFPELSANLSRPDIISIISNTYDKEDITDIVVIEFKRPDNKITPAGAEEQLLEYARYVNQTNEFSKIRIWTYAFLTFDEETCMKLKDKSYNKIPTHSDYSIYYKYHEAHNVIINFMDYKALADDANTRNKTFMDILKSN